MENAIEILQDQIIMLTGKIKIIETEDYEEITKTVLVGNWNKEIEELRKAQSILSNCC
jgi:S-adenosylhomocysteine hydrolase